MTRVADLVARTLAFHEVRHAFGMPGGEVVTLLDALDKAGITFVLARNETAAAIMAAGASLIGNAPGLLVTTLGPGLANAVNGIADAAQERVPLIVLSGVVDHDLRGRYTHQVVDHAALLRPLVKASFEIEPKSAAETMERAIALALAHPMGPVHVDIAPGTAARHADDTPTPPSRRQPLRAGLDPASPGITHLRDALAKARRPLILAGFAAARDPAAAAYLADFANAHAIPVITTYKAKGLVPETSDLSLGAAGLSPRADALLLPLVRQADLVLAIGYDPIEMRPGWLDFADPAKLIEIGAPFDHAMHSAGLILDAPVAAVLDVLRPFPATPPSSWPDGAPARVRRDLIAAFASAKEWGPHVVFDVLAGHLEDGDVLTIDSGAHRILLSQRFFAAKPVSVLQSTGWCTMGCAIPLAIGAALARPVARVVAVVGDGGLELTLGELGTIRDQKIPATVLVLQDESLALIELKQAQAGLDRNGVRMGATDYPTITKAFGGRGVAVRDAAALAKALDDARSTPDLMLISCVVEAKDYVGAL